MSDATPPAGFGRPELTAFARLDGLGLSVTGQRLEPDRAVLACRVVEPDQWCRRCGSEGAARDTVIRRLAHEPLGWRPTVLAVVVRRYRCADCGHVWRQDTSAAAEPRAKLSRTGLRWALEGIVVAHLTVARVAEGLGVAWDTTNNAVLAEGKRLLINDPTRFEGVKVIGVDEHVCRHTRRGDKYVTVVLLAIFGASDWVDGYLARALNQTSAAGAVLDPVADRIGVATIALALALAGHIDLGVVLVIAAVDVALAVLYLVTRPGGAPKVSRVGKVRTAPCSCQASRSSGSGLHPVGTAGAFVCIGGTILHAIAGFGYVRALLHRRIDGHTSEQ